MLKATLITICFCALAVLVSAQETVPELELGEEYRIIGRDTRIFSIRGDKIPTVDFVVEPLPLADERRTTISSQGMIDETERISRQESFTVTRGVTVGLDYIGGANHTNTVFGIVSFDTDISSATMKFSNRMAREHTPSNTAPFSQEFGAVGYLDGSFADMTIDVGFLNEEDNHLGENFRPGGREMSGYQAGISLRPVSDGTWDTSGRLTLKRGTYRDFDATGDRDETEFAGKVSAEGEVYDTTCLFQADITYDKLGGDSATLMTAGARGKWLIFNSIGIRMGGNIAVSSTPGEDTGTKIFPEAALDWSLTSYAFIRIRYQPGMTMYSFNDLYRSNGLITLAVPFLFEERKHDLDGEIGVRFGNGFKAAAGGFYRESKNALVYGTSGNYFDIVQGKHVTFSGARVRSSLNRGTWFGIEGELVINDATFENGGAVPFIPDFDVRLDGFFVPQHFWKVRGSLHFYGEHAVDATKTENSFFVIDMGVDREIYKQYLSAYIDIRNLTNTDGSWWTRTYQIPGLGLYAGLKAQY